MSRDATRRDGGFIAIEWVAAIAMLLLPAVGAGGDPPDVGRAPARGHGRGPGSRAGPAAALARG